MKIKSLINEHLKNQEEQIVEPILYKATISKILLIVPFLVLVFSCTGLFLDLSIILKAIPVLFALLFFVGSYYYIKNSFVYITNSKIHFHWGIISNNEDVILINKVSKIEVRQSIFEIVLNIGSVVVIDISGSKEVFYLLNNPKQIRNEFLKILK